MDVEARADPSNSFERMLAVLDLFTPEASSWTAEQISAAIGCSISTGYRYLRSLTQSGLLVGGEGGGFTLGPRIIQLDRQIRMSDPFIGAARAEMISLSARLGVNLIISSLYGDSVICVHEEHADRNISAHNLRGLAVPLFHGAVSKVILANLPVHRQRKFMLTYPTELANSDLGPNWDALRRRLRHVQRAGFCIAEGEVDPSLTGIAVPVFMFAGTQILGGLCAVFSTATSAVPSTETLVLELKLSADRIQQALAGPGPVAHRPARERRAPF